MPGYSETTSPALTLPSTKSPCPAPGMVEGAT
eukprot:CAMPEP_0175829450 /NCGR_PEP_ID=MMETSP0107_2-20121207/13341_1 /TAXON_ID=195067 ORGANISM="Goniomonas pacifica, Strain CCMP1869" /NCGR_SAMPLE_ID=MMETSP0107_2 /ASSEMBLY_ACC=CAM_ASM_000203 /LENGTH=31 /DNA_ID= /DNA_START= /DNA_END= /DNA_ORIENTATION=